MNIALRISEISKSYPDKKSVVFSQRQKDGSYLYPSYTFKEFEERSSQMAHEFVKCGITKGMRTLLFVTPRIDFSVITFALFKIGAVPVLIDPGMGIKNLLSSIKQVKPEALVSIGKVHWIRRLLPANFKSVRIKISLDPVGGRTSSLYKNLDSHSKSFAIKEVSPEDFSAILFTSGGTGIPKGVHYTHGILNAQTDLLQNMFSLSPSESDLPGFPLFALFTLAMGMTSVIPDMDPTRPASCDPKKIVQNIRDNNISFVAGSPAIWERVGKYCLTHKITLPSVKYVVMFGAPVRAEIHQMFKSILPNGDTFTPYGATECLPVSLISGSEILESKISSTIGGFGTCIGKPVLGTQVKIIKATDIPELSIFELPSGEVGEILVSGQQVTPSYFEMFDETNRAKISQQNILWHRMGDIGRVDSDGQVWFLGRKSHRVILDSGETIYPLEVEAVFNQHPEIRRSALIKLLIHGAAKAAIVIERHDGKTSMSGTFLKELEALKLQNPKALKVVQFFLHHSFPVDVRHNIKIDRLKLASWAQERIKNV